MKITFTNLDTLKTPKTLSKNQRQTKDLENQADQCCRHRSAKTEYLRCSNDDLSSGEGMKLLRLQAKTLTTL